MSGGGVYNWVAQRSGAGITVRGCDAGGQPVTLTGVTSIYVEADDAAQRPTVFAHGPGEARTVLLSGFIYRPPHLKGPPTSEWVEEP